MLEEDFMWAESDWLDPQARNFQKISMKVIQHTKPNRIISSKSTGTRPGTAAKADMLLGVSIDCVIGAADSTKLPLRRANQS